ncbi:MFS transporter [Saccharopolyspora erythraea NRRL 2338]|uniref:Transporter n=2 Tax=Saccharopolyspora erythraea TaxID=1836 RepID=A4FAG8_SACEN|nr:MFS transporter [Saccharopolyspora erythraea]EQD83307.1 MFS transporter [Saccharopolyspora erythraea D]PFG94830.1 MFS transporter [Saccharopolyspora erythraea NRRL 2338]QRK91539.1 MFS transporter [Saccharopolyspora erythraea]CAM01043.1 putative transporter [Saccharopolyspora erythraea NRRL 2338]
MRLLTRFRSFPAPVRMLMLNQLTINLGFYMLIPYLAAYLAGDLGLAVWVVGLVLGVRNFAQQGMFLIGGTLADRFGYKPLIVAGCALRTGGFALIGLVDSLPALLVASAATGFAGALFNPAVRAYLSAEAGDRRVEAFALFNVFYQTGILLGPLAGLALTGVAFEITCLAAAGIFLVLTVLQIRSLPQRTGAPARGRTSVLAEWRTMLGNGPFVLFSLVMTGSYVLNYQIYLALPLEARRLAGDERTATAAVAVLFAVSGVLAIAGQVRITAWCQEKFSPGTCLAGGLALMGLSFLPLLAGAAQPGQSTVATFGPLVLSAAMLSLGTLVVFPFEMDTIVRLSGERLVASYYGLYNTVCGVGIMLGNLLTGSALDVARGAGLPWLPWSALCALGLVCGGLLWRLHRSRRWNAQLAAV